MTILDTIVARRKERILREGAAQGLDLPPERRVPVVPFGQEPFLICEIKRRSPSRGAIRADLDPVTQAETYHRAGAVNISVLTEQDHFGGSLADLTAVKRRFPDKSILRKDFLLSREDLDVTFQAGADAFLLIASILPRETLEDLYLYGLSLGLTPLVEIHDREDAEKAAAFRPGLTGINCRDLRTFTTDLTHPLKMSRHITWPCRKVFESGILSAREGEFALGAGFDGLLVGEAVVRNPETAGELRSLFPRKRSLQEFYRPLRELYRRKQAGRPLVKICGITRREDALTAMELGADMLGFVLADSPRRITPEKLRSFRDLPVLKAGVVVLKPGESLPRPVRELLEEGALDLIQFHGSEEPEILRQYPGYKALRMRSPEDLEALSRFSPPPVLTDAWSPRAAGGTGERIAGEIMEPLARRPALWLAGGIRPDNVREILSLCRPDLIDLSSGVEASPGIKDRRALKQLFTEIRAMD